MLPDHVIMDSNEGLSVSEVLGIYFGRGIQPETLGDGFSKLGT